MDVPCLAWKVPCLPVKLARVSRIQLMSPIDLPLHEKLCAIADTEVAKSLGVRAAGLNGGIASSLSLPQRR